VVAQPAVSAKVKGNISRAVFMANLRIRVKRVHRA